MPVPLLSWNDTLPCRPSRVLVAGTSGSGKTTLARLVARCWQLPRVELDALHHGENWVPRPTFVPEVRAFARQPRWVTEWQYTAKLGDILYSRADCVLWLDHPRHLVMRQVIARTVIRRIRREQLWNGNVEPPLRTVFTDADHVIRWAWRTQGGPGQRVTALLGERGRDVVVVRLRGRRQADRWTGGNLGISDRGPAMEQKLGPLRDPDAP
jgi:adenylate kinase family enzyme